jgi:hypothetical protein
MAGCDILSVQRSNKKKPVKTLLENKNLPT